MYKPIFIAGPCVIETFDILEEVAKELVRLNNKYGYIFPYSHWVFSFLVCQDWRGVLFPLSGRADIFSIQVFMEVYLLSFSIFC